MSDPYVGDPIPPAVLARIDQARAELERLVGLARQHQCGHPACVGKPAVDRLLELSEVDRGRVLVLALHDLACGGADFTVELPEPGDTP